CCRCTRSIGCSTRRLRFLGSNSPSISSSRRWQRPTVRSCSALRSSRFASTVCSMGWMKSDSHSRTPMRFAHSRRSTRPRNRGSSEQFLSAEDTELPERGILAIRKALGLFANLRPALLYPELSDASTLKAEVVAGLDLMIVRELTGDIYFGQPRGRRSNAAGEAEGFDTMLYSASEI